MKTLASMAAALAAALAVPAAAAPTYDWSGFYIGVHGTAVRENTRASGTAQLNQVTNLIVPNRAFVVVPGTTRAFDIDSKQTDVSGGIQGGFQMQWGGLVAGLEGDADFTRRRSRGSQTSDIPMTALTPISTVTFERGERYDLEWSARARIGGAFGSNLLYATGGLAGTRVRITRRDTFSDPGGPAAPNSINGQTTSVGQANFGPAASFTTDYDRKWKTGWTAGAGFERKLGSHLSIGVEYRHTDYGTVDAAFPVTFTGTSLTAGTTPHGAVTVTSSITSDLTSAPNVASAPTRVRLRNDGVGLRLNFTF
jgi:high affinity Mn2+ porin